eukprot:1143026-Pelagomonas_calceolata.AAC.1
MCTWPHPAEWRQGVGHHEALGQVVVLTEFSQSGAHKCLHDHTLQNGGKEWDTVKPLGKWFGKMDRQGQEEMDRSNETRGFLSDSVGVAVDDDVCKA